MVHKKLHLRCLAGCEYASTVTTKFFLIVEDLHHTLEMNCLNAKFNCLNCYETNSEEKTTCMRLNIIS